MPTPHNRVFSIFTDLEVRHGQSVTLQLQLKHGACISFKLCQPLTPHLQG
jgi:hypothetical protein